MAAAILVAYVLAFLAFRWWMLAEQERGLDISFPDWYAPSHPTIRIERGVNPARIAMITFAPLVAADEALGWTEWRLEEPWTAYPPPP